jgi:hypothetical protein
LSNNFATKFNNASYIDINQLFWQFFSLKESLNPSKFELKLKAMMDKLIKEMEFNRFGWIAIILLVVGCLGGLTVGMGAIGSTFALIAIVVPTMLTLSLLLAVAPMRWIAMASIVSIGIDLLFFSYYLTV